jgi:Fe2+ or Zn2+ uptake regulation protein
MAKVVIAKNQTKLMEIFEKFPEEEFAQKELWEQTQIKYPASVHSALMALVKKGEIQRHEVENGSRTHVRYKKSTDQ